MTGTDGGGGGGGWVEISPYQDCFAGGNHETMYNGTPDRKYYLNQLQLHLE